MKKILIALAALCFLAAAIANSARAERANDIIALSHMAFAK